MFSARKTNSLDCCGRQKKISPSARHNTHINTLLYTSIHRYMFIYLVYIFPPTILISIYMLIATMMVSKATDENIDSAPVEPPVRPRETAIVPQHPALASPIPRLAPQNPRSSVVRHREALPLLQPENPQTTGCRGLT